MGVELRIELEGMDGNYVSLSEWERECQLLRSERDDDTYPEMLGRQRGQRVRRIGGIPVVVPWDRFVGRVGG